LQGDGAAAEMQPELQLQGLSRSSSSSGGGSVLISTGENADPGLGAALEIEDQQQQQQQQRQQQQQQQQQQCQQQQRQQQQQQLDAADEEDWSQCSAAGSRSCSADLAGPLLGEDCEVQAADEGADREVDDELAGGGTCSGWTAQQQQQGSFTPAAAGYSVLDGFSSLAAANYPVITSLGLGLGLGFDGGLAVGTQPGQPGGLSRLTRLVLRLDRVLLDDDSPLQPAGAAVALFEVLPETFELQVSLILLIFDL
jgi:type II secretory pathway pseudopilin PulG